MRIFALVFGGLVVMVALGIMGWFGREKVVMGMAAYSLRNDIAQLKKFRYDGSAKGCVSLEHETNRVTGYQLRFISDTEYVFEVVCEHDKAGNILKNGLLAGGVKRLYGSGIMLAVDEKNVEPTNAWVHLKYGDTIVAVGFFNNVADIKWNAREFPIGGDTTAQANCSDWGFVCCKSGTENGQGAQVFTLDCPKNCHQTCNQLPVVVFFNTSPLMDAKSRVLLLNSRKSSVDFGFEITDFDGNVEQSSIDFGDGTVSGEFGAKASPVSHEYSCDTSRCVYRAVLSAVDSEGNNLENSHYNQIQVILEP
jgi:hypothetical protein